MMRPMKLAGDELVFGKNALAHLATLQVTKIVIILGSDRFYKNGLIKHIENPLRKAGIAFEVFIGVEADPGFKTVLKGASFMLKHEPDLILAVGGGSVMDAAKAMWIYYEHPTLTSLKPLMNKETFPTLRHKARFACVPTTAGSASEVSRSIVITDDETHIKYGIGNMEMMPDIAILDPVMTTTMPASITAQTGMDTITHAMEALVSTRANDLSDLFAKKAIKDGFETLPHVIKNPNNLGLREKMLNASMIAGMAFTNVSLGIVHSIAHSLGSLFNLSHGLANAVLLPYVISFNQSDERANNIYGTLADDLGVSSIPEAIWKLNENLGIKSRLKDYLQVEEACFMEKLDDLISLSINDGCTKTNPIVPDYDAFKTLILKAYHGNV